MDVIKAGCKVNLGLRITGVRPDGYHLLDSLFWPLSEPHDLLKISPAQNGLTIRCADPDFPVANTLTKAYALFKKATGDAPAVHLTLHKGIPQGAGLGGGSSDAAALLKWLNLHQGSPLDIRDMLELATLVGADTPFFLQDEPCRVRGIGEILEPYTSSLAKLHLVLVCPDIHVSTAWAFAAYDTAPPQPGGLTITDSKAKKLFLSEAQYLPDMHNDLEAIVLYRYPQLAEIKTALLHLGAKNAGMSGSGSSMVGLFADGDAAHAAVLYLQKEHRRVFTHEL